LNIVIVSQQNTFILNWLIRTVFSLVCSFMGVVTALAIHEHSLL
jgi:hypothetical protein